LLQANLKNDPAILDEISNLLTELKGAWESIRPQNVTPVSVVQQQQAATNSNKPALVYGRG
jgi:flagellar secretion chaperone FliS